MRRKVTWLLATLGDDLYKPGVYDELDEQQLASDDAWRGRVSWLGEKLWMSFEQMEVIGPALVLRSITEEVLTESRERASSQTNKLILR